MIQKKQWSEFYNTGLLLIINQILQVFGWSIVIEFDETKEIKEVYPVRSKFRGFDNNSVRENHIKITEYLKNNIQELEKEANN
ncbi:hypothetical protein HX001_18100 [Empedobacter brevis]|uniref:Uncharacterized protein n=1 Tax=Empedobacter brevis TaxID=247 RepID=A0AAJ1QHX4_9FLAO|nr:hypothetical protein [Empedobacter brevis]MDM1074395.1 hypothetical protein [Empedobacter brevis]